MKNCRDSASSLCDLETGLPAFQLPMFATCDALKEICLTCLPKESIPAIPLGNSKHPFPIRSLRFLRVAARSTSFALWLHHALSYLAAAGQNPSHAEKKRVRSQSNGLQDPLQYSECALSCAM